MRQPKTHPTTPSRNRQNVKAAIARVSDIITENFEGIGYWYSITMNKTDRFYMRGSFERPLATIFVRNISRSLKRRASNSQYIYCISPATEAGFVVNYISNVPPDMAREVFEHCASVVEWHIVCQIAPGTGQEVACKITDFAKSGSWRYDGGAGERLFTASHNLWRY